MASSPEIQSPKNVAAWALQAHSPPLVVSNAPYKGPPEDHVVIKVYDVAINPIDWIMQDSDIFHSSYPAIYGHDIAGEIFEVASGVNDFHIGQRVIAHSVRINGDVHAGGAFQKYATVHKTAIAELPYSIPSSVGVVLPLAVTTAAAGLYQQGYLSLPLPTESPEPQNRTILVWGGSSSVGSAVIQLAVASGVDVIATASPSNFEHCKSLGAIEVFDYHKDDVDAQIVDYLNHKTLAGAYHAAGSESAVQACARVADKANGKAVVVTVRGEPKEGIPSTVRVKPISATTVFTNEVGPYIWRKFLPGALKSGAVLPKPDPLIVGEELRSVQHGLDVQRRGVSARKVVVSYIS